MDNKKDDYYSFDHVNNINYVYFTSMSFGQLFDDEKQYYSYVPGQHWSYCYIISVGIKRILLQVTLNINCIKN